MANGGSRTQVAVEDSIARLVERLVVFLALIFLAILSLWMVASASGQSTDIRFNPYALISAACFISTTVALVLVLRIKQQTETLMWFTIYLLSIMAWSGTEVMIRLSASPHAAVFWAPMNTLGSVVLPIALYMFVLSFTSPKRARNPVIYPIIAMVSGLLLYADARTNLLTVYDPSKMTHTAWGYVSTTGNAFFLLALWIILLCLASIVLLYRFGKHTIDKTLRAQSRLFIVAITIPLVAGTITDGLLPILHVVIIPPSSITFLSVSAIIICYGILRHRFISLTPEVIAGQILDTMNEAVISIRPDLSFNFANIGAERMFGISAAKFSSHKLSDFIGGDISPEGLADALISPLQHEDTHTIDSIDFKTAAGPVITTKLSITRVPDSDGYLVVLTDITEIAHTKTIIEKEVADRTNELNQEHARLQAAINSIDVGLLMTFKERSAISYNTALPHILGIKQPQTEDGKTKLLSIDDIEDKLVSPKFNLRQAIAEAQDKGQPFEFNDFSYDNRILTIFGAPIMVRLDKIIGTVVLIEDITEQKVLERSKDEFFSIASHELRTPLTSIKGNTSMILDFYKDVLKDPQLKEMVSDVHESAVRLIEIVNDFLDTSRLEQGKMKFEYEEVNLEEVIESVVYEMKAMLDDRGIYLKLNKLTLNQLPRVWADKNKIKQVLYNLVGNAAKFTDHGGIIIDSAKDGDDVKVTVIDTGRGMAPEARKLLFHKFQQAGSSLITRDTTRGTGLGLYISKMLLENMNGSIALDESIEGKGSSFSFRIPIATEASKKAVQQSGETTDTETGLSAKN